MAFVHRHALEAKPSDIDKCLVVQGDRLLARADTSAGVMLPVLGELGSWPERPAGRPPLHVGLLDDGPIWLFAIEDAAAAAPAGWAWQEARSLLAAFTPSQAHAVGCARELDWWQSRHRFCGHCGTPTVDTATERAKRCPKCHTQFFPVVSPAVIVAVTRGNELLLAHNRNFRPGLFSLLAGFVEPGETLEQAAVREVREEVGLEIGDLHYISSQPWPFPNSLMAGFRATYRSGEIAVDGQEIEQAGWYTRDALPEIPRSGTVASFIISGWLRE